MTEKLNLESVLKLISEQRINEVEHVCIELKSDWHQDHGKDISAIANHANFVGGWLVIGVNDRGQLLGKDAAWEKRTEEQISNHVNQYLFPSWAVKNVKGHNFEQGHCILIEVVNPGDVTEWNNKSYRVCGTVSKQMTPDEEIALSMQLPGEDFSKSHWNGAVDAATVFEFAKKVQESEPHEFPEDLANTTPVNILKKLNLWETAASGILFGDYKVRVIHFDADEEILDQSVLSGAFNILSDKFISQIHSWTRKQAAGLKGQTISTSEEEPYPPKAIREVLANAVAHALYYRDGGDIKVEMHPGRIVISNNCNIEAKNFSKRWFSRDTFARNKLLMRTLRAARITDELGTGKSRIFRQMIESGKREPIIEFLEFGNFGRWSVTLYNEEQNLALLETIKRFQAAFNHPDYWRIATALLLWRENSWTQIQEKLDEHFKRVAVNVVRSEASPVIIIGDRLFVKRWAEVSLTGQMSRRFTEAEERQIKSVLQEFAFAEERAGNISTDEARRIIGLSTSKSEITQLSNLFRKWADDKAIKMVKRGHWRFLTEAEKSHEIIMTFLGDLNHRVLNKPGT